MANTDDDSWRDRNRRSHQERTGDGTSSSESENDLDIGLGRQRDGRRAGADQPRADTPEQPPDDLMETHESWEAERREAMGLALEAEDDEDEEVELPYVLERSGQFGVVVALFGLFLSVFGVGAASLGIQPLGNVSMFFSLVLVTSAMIFAVIIRAYRSDFSIPNVGA